MSNDNNNPMDSSARLGKLLQEKAAEIGLDMQGFILAPDMSGGSEHTIQAVFFVNETPPIEESDDDVWNVLQGTLEATADAERERARQEQEEKDQAKRDAAIDRLLSVKKNLGGFLD